MLQSIKFTNFKVLKDATLPLSPFTLIVGANGSGKSTALQGLTAMQSPGIVQGSIDKFLSAGMPPQSEVAIVVEAILQSPLTVTMKWPLKVRQKLEVVFHPLVSPIQQQQDATSLSNDLQRLQIYALEPEVIARTTTLLPNVQLASNGGNLAGVLDNLRDSEPEKFESLNQELNRWFPEFDRILFETPGQGIRAFLLRTKQGHYRVPAPQLSQGTLLALVILTLCYIPHPPTILGIEEPDRGVHPRLLREVQDALYRLSYPQMFGDSRPPIQVIATTHSPYFLDLFRDHPEEVVIAQKEGLTARFERLSERKDIEDILGHASLGDVWYTGILGGVPSETSNLERISRR